MTAYHHVVLFRVHDESAVAEVFECLDASRPTKGLLEWTVVRSLDDRKGPVVVESAVFVDRMAYDDFAASPAHREAGVRLSGIADWWVGDWQDDNGASTRLW